ncbi:D-glycero-beta-D-manno-heptose 1-phosphate adenylyltransferase [Nannocystis bainbridge]|uniref:Bifunctional protein HldE n=1 Tax=Nannocystis bainbridge TaxID=2995303 RepID=A0ABT5DPS4_9BACT|nr:D-glycero-beta-D-manno-heptose 1-phosphate adenylyltransferase [Nannocystis bainbridge]MDC0715662.1 D-glycero-beta-D-manno-heptose 1-phosphate adenylyltransferase [Nannocystis bainbridge]
MSQNTSTPRAAAMTHVLLPVLDAFAGLRTLVIGEAMLDAYLDGHSERLCREAPVPVVDVDARRDVPGGGANTAVNAAALGARVTFLSVVGADDDADRLARSLVALGVCDRGLVRAEGRRTLVKQRILAGGQILLRLDAGSRDGLDPACEARLRERLRAAWREADAVIVSDYGYGVLTDGLIDELAALQAAHARVLVADAKDLRRLARARPTAVKPNYAEAARLLGLSNGHGDGRVEQIAAHEAELLQTTGARVAAVTLDSAGALVFETGQPAYRTYASPSSDANATGAGDTFVSALALALAAGAPTHACADLASGAAARVVARDGTTACTAAELRVHFAAQDKLLGPDDLARLADSLHRAGKRLVFTNGCFDILHRGHITCLSRAKALGDVLIVGLNADASVRRLKGAARPINCAADRAQVLAALSCVDHIVEFADDTPARLIELARPDIYVKGGDYRLDTLPEAPLVARLGGEVRLMPYLEHFSTTGLLARIGAGRGDA